MSQAVSTSVSDRTQRAEARRRHARRTKGIAFVATVVISYLVYCAWVYFAQDSLVFPAAGAGYSRLTIPAGVEVIELGREGRARIAVATPRSKPRGVLIHFVGNGEDLSSGVRWSKAFTDFGLVSLVPEYPGYGQSEGSPSVESFFAMAERVADEAQRRATELGVPLFVSGWSIGTFSAVHLASKGYGQRLLLAAPPTNILEIARREYPLAPISWLLAYPFDSAMLASKVQMPTLILHGDADRVVPLSMGRALATALPNARMLVVKGGHALYGRFEVTRYKAEIEALLFE